MAVIYLTKLQNLIYKKYHMMNSQLIRSLPPGKINPDKVYNNSKEQTAREHWPKFKFSSREPNRQCSLNQRKVSI